MLRVDYVYFSDFDLMFDFIDAAAAYSLFYRFIRFSALPLPATPCFH